MSNRQDYSSLHTLAVAYAEQGRLNLALSTIKEALARTRDYPVPPSAFYVYGRAAEALGFPEDARAYYERCQDPERAFVDPVPSDDARERSTWTLAKRRLAALAAAPTR